MNPLSSLQPEQLVIGACLLNPSAIPFAHPEVSPEDFVDARMQTIYETILELHRNNEPVEPFIVYQRSVENGLKGINAAELHQWVEQVGSGYSVGHYAKIVREQSTRRRLVDLTYKFHMEINDQEIPAPDAIQRMLQGLEEVRDTTISSELLAKSLGEILATPETAEDWIIPNLLEAGDRMILTGYEGLGKTLWLRQLGITAAAGIHPITLDHLAKPIKVLYVDVENSEKQWRRETYNIAATAAQHGLESPNENIHVYCGQRMDLRKDRDLGLVHKLVDQHQPEILVIGPLYRLVPTGINNDEEAAPLIAALDTLSDRGLALLMEAHAPKGQNGERFLAPRGSAALMGWPEFGFGLAPQENGSVKVSRWRGDRDQNRDWPDTLWKNGPYPWTADNVDNATRQSMYARDNGGF